MRVVVTSTLSASLAACATIVGCSAFGSDASSTPPVGAPDASSPDADSADASAQPSDAGANSACAKDHPSAAFCDDFDNGGYRSEWTRDVPGNGASLAIISNPHVSAPFALAARTVATAPTGGASAFLRGKQSTAGKTQFRLEAQVQMTAATPVVTDTAPQALLLHLGPKAFVLFQIRTTGGVAACTTSGAELGNTGVGDVPFSYGAWHHVVLEAAVGDGGSTVDVSCDVDGVRRSGTQTDVVDATADLSVGLGIGAGQAALTVLFDDVVYDAK